MHEDHGQHIGWRSWALRSGLTLAWLAMLMLLAAVWVPETSSTSRDQEIFVDRGADAGLSSDAVPLKIDRFG
jgi:hypothetical protein